MESLPISPSSRPPARTSVPPVRRASLDRRFVLLVGWSVAAYAAGIYISDIYALSVTYTPLSFAACTRLSQVITVFLLAYLRVAWLLFPLLAAGYSRFCRPVCLCVLGLRAFPCGVVCGLLYRCGTAWQYLLFFAYAVGIQAIYLYVCRMAHQCAYAMDGTPRLFRSAPHDRVYLARFLRACGLLALLCALRCAVSLNGTP